MKVRRAMWLAATSQIGFFSSLPVNGLRIVTMRFIPTVRSTCLMASLYCCEGMNGSSFSSGKVLYLSRITLAVLLRGTTTVRPFSLMVFVGMYSNAPFTISHLVSRRRSLTRQPTLHWKMNTSLCFSSSAA